MSSPAAKCEAIWKPLCKQAAHALQRQVVKDTLHGAEW